MIEILPASQRLLNFALDRSSQLIQISTNEVRSCVVMRKYNQNANLSREIYTKILPIHRANIEVELCSTRFTEQLNSLFDLNKS